MGSKTEGLGDLLPFLGSRSIKVASLSSVFTKFAGSEKAELEAETPLRPGVDALDLRFLREFWEFFNFCEK